MSGRDFARRVGLGKLAFALWHGPLGRIRSSLRNGGPLVERATERDRREMEAAATALPRLPHFSGTPQTVHLMTGRRFWYQTAFCLYSLSHASQAPLHVEIYDDGTLDETCRAYLNRLGISMRVHSIVDLRRKRDQLLPIDRFPVLRERWENYPNIRKLIDVHLGSTGWKLVIDSDLIFFRRPGALLDWLKAPDRILYAIDSEESYGYSRPLLKQLAGHPIPVRLNVGICGLKSDALDWTELEAWTAELHRREKTNYYLEQALVAMLAAREPSLAVSASEYVTFPSQAEVINPQAIMHHYVATAKRWYFRYGWQHVIANC
jgi:hypothetical protein